MNILGFQKSAEWYWSEYLHSDWS